MRQTACTCPLLQSSPVLKLLTLQVDVEAAVEQGFLAGEAVLEGPEAPAVVCPKCEAKRPGCDALPQLDLCRKHVVAVREQELRVLQCCTQAAVNSNLFRGAGRIRCIAAWVVACGRAACTQGSMAQRSRLLSACT